MLGALNASWLLMALAALAGENPAMAKGLSFAELKQRSLAIEKMPQVQRDSLQRNWKTFQALPDDQKQRYRDLHHQLEQDQQSGNQLKLNETLQIYETWLQTLAPGERVALRQATSPQERLKLVQEIKADKERRNQSRALSDPADDPSRVRWRMRRNMAPPLSPSELSAVMEALAAALPAPDQDGLKHLDPQLDKWLRYSRIIEASARQAGGPQSWPNLNQQAAMSAAIPKSETARQLKSLSDDPRRIRWGTILFSSCGDELMKLREQFAPKENDLPRLFEQLEARDREKWMSFPKERLHLELKRRYFEELASRDPEYRKLDSVSREFFNFAYQFMGKAGMTPAGFFRGGGPPGGGRRFGPDGPRDGRGFRDDRNRDRDGPPPDRPPPEDRFRPPPRDGERPPPDRPRDGE